MRLNCKFNTLLILHQNIAGLLSKKDLLELVLKDLYANNGKYVDVICLSETFVRTGDEANINIEGFELAAWFSRSKRRGGTCILCRDHLETKPLNFLNEFKTELYFEVCGTEIKHLNCIVICIYRIPNCNYILFMNNLDALLKIVRTKTRKQVIITGDFNIDFLKPSHQLDEFNKIIHNYNFKAHINLPTRLNTCIDQILSNISEAVGEVLPLNLSDHNTGQTLRIPKLGKYVPSSYEYVKKRDFSHELVEKFCHTLACLSWNEVYSEPDANIAFNNFYDVYTMFFNLWFPVCKVKVTKTRHCNKWMTKGLRNALKTKRYLRYRYYEDKTIENKLKYNRYNKLLKKCVLTSRKLENKAILYNAKNISKTSWEVINTDTGKINKRNKMIDKIICNNQSMFKPIDIANVFNDFFINTTHKNYNFNNNFNQYDYSLQFNNSNMFLFPIDPIAVVNIIKKLSNTRSVGYDDIPTHIVKSTSDIIAPVLSHLINMTFQQGVFPDKLKISIVKPIFKAGDKNFPGNYRPITLIPIFAKILEKAMYTRLMSFIKVNEIISDHQNGFQKGKSTSLATFNLINKIVDNVDKGHKTVAIFFDMSKAFDHVSHKLLLKKCETYGMRGLAYSWLESYLSNRRQIVEVVGSGPEKMQQYYRSSVLYNRVGVPQGTILGPILFLLYINDLPLVTNHNCTLFADDISIVISDMKNQNYENVINTATADIIKWLNYNNLQVNIEKTKYIQFVNRGKKEKLNVVHNGQTLVECDTTTFLGFALDDRCTWKMHVDKVCSKVNRFVYVLWRLTRITDMKTALMAYHAFVVSNLRYGILIWGNSSHVRRTLIAQKQCIRAICNIPRRTSCKSYFVKLKLLTVHSIYIYEVCVFVKQHPDMFTTKRDITRFNTRYPDRLVLPNMNTVMRSKSCYSMCIKIFNRLPDELKKLPITTFKKKLFSFLVEKCYYSLNDFLCNN
jgi:hypothetical protein